MTSDKTTKFLLATIAVALLMNVFLSPSPATVSAQIPQPICEWTYLSYSGTPDIGRSSPDGGRWVTLGQEGWMLKTAAVTASSNVKYVFERCR
jgi:hypothetical protein